MNNEAYRSRLCALVALVVAAAPARGLAAEAEESPRPTVIVVQGAPGTEEYGEEFARWAACWQRGAATSGAAFIAIGGGSGEGADTSDRVRLRQVLKESGGASPHAVWLVLIGHGTFDGRTARFNLRGPDVTAGGLADWLKPIERPVAVINCAAASGPFVNRLSAPGRVVVTAAKSGYEQNFARFGKYLSAAIVDEGTDLDKDGQTSLLEAWLTAARQVEEFYETAGRLATEHSLLDDNGDGRAARADFFRGVRPIKQSAGGGAVDGYRAHQFHLVQSAEESRLPPGLRQRRNELELAVAALRGRKERLEPDAYHAELETLLVRLAEVYERAETTRPTVIPASAESRE